LNFVDIFVIIVMGVFALIGFWKGFVMQLFQAAGIFCAFYFNTSVSRFIADILSTEPEGIILFLIGIASFLLIYSVFFIAGFIIGKSFDLVLTSLPNRIAGIFFGAVNGFLAVTVIFLIVRSFEKGDELLKKYVTPDRATDELIRQGLEFSGSEDGRSLSDNSFDYDETRGSKIYSRLGYGAYRISMFMDPFVNNIKNIVREKTENMPEV
jgi:uncharacterized membrane protein required for colicin V production